MTKNNKHPFCNLHEWFSCRTVVLILSKKVTHDLPKFPEQKFGLTQQQFFNLPKISIQRDNIYQLDHRCIITYKNIRGKIRSDIKLINV